MKLRIDRREFFIDGTWATPASDANIPVICPATEEPVGSAPMAAPSDVDRAVIAARRAFDEGPWRQMSLDERVSIVTSVRNGIVNRAEELATLLTLELGAPYSQQLAGVGDSPINYIDDAISAARRLLTDQEIRHDRKGAALILREPVGVCASITPFNGPLVTAVLKVIPAILVGCTVVLKPSELTPLDNFIFAELLNAAGMPPGVVNVITGDGEVGAYLVAHPGVDKVAFTGGTATGRRIAASCGKHLKRLHLELGGNSAAIVLDDVDLDSCMPRLAAGALASQVCIALSRVLVPRSRHDEIVDALCAAAANRRPGDPFDPTTTLSPLISARHRDKVEQQIAHAVEDGCVVAAGGHAPMDLKRGYYLEPTVLTNANNDMSMVREEIFGPVVSVIPYDTVDDAIRIANDSEYGLHGAVFTADNRAGLEVARQVRTGSFALNTFGFTVSAPFGGRGQSGYGREHGPEGLEEFLYSKSITLLPDAADMVRPESNLTFDRHEV